MGMGAKVCVRHKRLPRILSKSSPSRLSSLLTFDDGKTYSDNTLVTYIEWLTLTRTFAAFGHPPRFIASRYL